jgi:hypothetical protein
VTSEPEGAPAPRQVCPGRGEFPAREHENRILDSTGSPLRNLLERSSPIMTDSPTLIFRVSLDEDLYRDIEIPGSKTLYGLAEAIVEAYDFDFDHAFGFYSKIKGHIFDSPIKYELFADMGESDARSVKRTRISAAFPKVGTKMSFLFDYGDDWRFSVELIGKGQSEPRAKYPKIIASVGEAPEQYPTFEDECS